MRPGRFAGIIALGIVAGGAACGAPSAENTGASSAAVHSEDDQEKAFLTLINQYRQSKGVGPLVATPLLNDIAWQHSNDMAVNNYFSHNDQQGHSPFDRMKAAGYQGGYEGENIAAGSADAQATFTMWKNSPGHDANMVDAHYVAIGIGRAYSASATYGWYWTTDFGDVIDPSVNPPADAGAPADTGAGSDAGVDAPTVAPDTGPPPGCTQPSGIPSHDSRNPTPLGPAYCASLAASGDDWFRWSATAATTHYDVSLAAAGDAQIAMWELVNGAYQPIPNTSGTEIRGTSSTAGRMVVVVWSPTRAAQSYQLTLAQ